MNKGVPLFYTKDHDLFISCDFIYSTHAFYFYQNFLVNAGGSYSLFAGRDATRALSKMQLDPSLFSNEYDDLTDISDKERATARSWHEDFRGNIHICPYIKINENILYFPFYLYLKKNMILLDIF